MKTMRKLLAMTLVLAMVLALAVTASAATITIDKGAANSEYAAWKLLNATDGGDGKFAYTVNETYRTALQTVVFAGKTSEDWTIKADVTDADIIDFIGKMTTDSDEIRTFADDVYAEIKTMDPDATTSTDEFENVAQGYYLIAETKTGNDQDTYSLVMLDTAGKGEVTVETKEDSPTLEKKVQETNDSTGVTSSWQDGADYDIGDHVPYQLTGTVSDKYADYKTYYYAFHDKLSAGLTFDPSSVVVKVDDVKITSGFIIIRADDTDNLLEDDCTFEVRFPNLKDIASVNANSKITVEFTATLNEDAVHGNPGNPNEAKLEYSNNPYDEGDGKPETGETPEDKVVVFTYKLIADKVDGKGEVLEGAGFTLYKKYTTPGVDGAEDTVEWRQVGDPITGVTTFTFTGLDAGEYKLVETTVPAGYNKADDIYFTIEATYDTNSADPKLTGLVVKDKEGKVISTGEDAVFSTDVSKGSVNTNVVNNSGVELPSTGGIGTTIFYIIGGLLAVSAVVLLVTKKKMSVTE